MPSLCPTCVETDISSQTCPACGGRVISHPELFDLSIAHIDADAFYASVEKLDHPELRDRPVIVGSKSGRGVITTACYIARAYGVRSAQPMFTALQRCPDAVIMPVRSERYREVSAAIRAKMEALTPQLRSVSLDEAYLDLTATRRLHGAPPAVVLARLAREIREDVGIGVSIGLSHAPFLAKIASDLEKPCGFSAIGRAETLSFLESQPVSILSGVGDRTRQSLEDMGIFTLGQLRHANPVLVFRKLGASGMRLMSLADGKDDRRIEPNEAAKSISAETTFERDIASRKLLESALWPLCEKVSARAKSAGVVGDTITLKAKLHDHRTITRQVRAEFPTQLAEEIFQGGRGLLTQLPARAVFRLIGVVLGDLHAQNSGSQQARLFDDGASRREAAERALDDIRARFGAKAAFKGRSLKS